ncbi:MAG: hypothetical protein ACFE8N_08565 [Promethearchaeota archaeon]
MLAASPLVTPKFSEKIEKNLILRIDGLKTGLKNKGYSAEELKLGLVNIKFSKYK